FAMILSLFAGMVADWDTAFIRYHLAHARVLAVIAWIFTLIAIPLAIALLLADYAIIAVIPLVFLFILWAYAWFLGFHAYSGKITICPLIRNLLESRKKLVFGTLENAVDPE